MDRNSDSSQDDVLPDSWSEWLLRQESEPIIDKFFKGKLFENINASIT